jgi:hypothetical protein
MFWLERVRIVRAPFIDRFRDPIWIVGMILIFGGFVTMTGCEFISPRAFLSHVDGSCTIGIHPTYATAVIAVDTFFNFLLMGIFILQFRPADGFAACKPVMCKVTRETDNRTSSIRASLHRDLRRMLVKNVVGSIFMLLATAVNNILFITQEWANESHSCQLLCLSDGMCPWSAKFDSDSANLR